MLELYISELRRFRNAAAIYGIANLVILLALEQLADLPNEVIEVHLAMLTVYMLSGLGFALYQFGSYRQPGRWIWLLHRPLHRARILVAIVLAALTVIALAIALPLFTVLTSQAHFTHHVIDRRHYAGAAFLALSALSAWLAGGYMMLNRSRWAFLILVLPLVLTMRLATASTVLGLSLCCDAVLLFLLYTVFRPSRDIGSAASATIANALPMQVSFYLALVWGGSMLFQLGQMIFGVYPLSSDHVPRGGNIEIERSYPNEVVLAGLAGSADPRAAAWRASLDRDNTVSVSPKVRQYAVHDLISTVGVAMFNDDENHWTYSHDRMMYRGVNRRTRKDKGWLGAGERGTTPFGSQPTVIRDNRKTIYVVNVHDLYALNAARSTLHQVLHLGGREELAGGVAVLDRRTLVLTNRRLIVLEPATVQPSITAEVKLPMPFGDLDRVDASTVADGTLVSLASGYRRSEGVAGAPQIVYLVDSTGHVREVARRELTHDFPLLFEHKAWWASPVLYSLLELPDLLIDNGTVPDDGTGRFAPLLRPRPAQVWLVAIAALLSSAAGAFWWTRRADLTPQARFVWCLACLVLGVPAFLSLMVLKPREYRTMSGTMAVSPAHA